jgi:hypothetical protein
LYYVYFNVLIQKVGGAACEYSFPYTDVDSFVALANIVTQVGIGAYSGAIPLFESQTTEKASIAILPIESRHNAFLRADGLDYSPFPADYDTALTANQSWTLASPLITSCPASNPPLFVTPLPALTGPSNTYDITAGSAVDFTFKVATPACGCGFAAWQQGLQIVFTPVTFTGPGAFSTIVPPDFQGVAFVTLTSSNNATDASGVEAATIAGPAAVLLS